MLETTIGVFRTVGWLLFWLVVGAFALLGLSTGKLVAYGSDGSAFIGLLVGGGLGFVVASCIFGTLFLLISINDQSVRLVQLQERTVALLERGGAASPAGTKSDSSIASFPNPVPDRTTTPGNSTQIGSAENDKLKLDADGARRLLERNRYSISTGSSRFAASELQTPQGGTLQAYGEGEFARLLVEEAKRLLEGWRQELLLLSVNGEVDINGLKVVKRQDATGRIAFVADRNYTSVDELLMGLRNAHAPVEPS